MGFINRLPDVHAKYSWTERRCTAHVRLPFLRTSGDCTDRLMLDAFKDENVAVLLSGGDLL